MASGSCRWRLRGPAHPRGQPLAFVLVPTRQEVATFVVPEVGGVKVVQRSRCPFRQGVGLSGLYKPEVKLHVLLLEVSDAWQMHAGHGHSPPSASSLPGTHWVLITPSQILLVMERLSHLDRF